MTVLLGIDPGVTTGFCLLSQDLITTEIWQTDTGCMAAVWNELEDSDPDRIAYENFKHRPNLMNAELHSLKVIGVVELFSEISDKPIVGKYLPAECKAFWTNDKIKRLGKYQSATPHGLDALRVCLTHFSKDINWFNDTVKALSQP